MLPLLMLQSNRLNREQSKKRNPPTHRIICRHCLKYIYPCNVSKRFPSSPFLLLARPPAQLGQIQSVTKEQNRASLSGNSPMPADPFQEQRAKHVPPKQCRTLILTEAPSSRTRRRTRRRKHADKRTESCSVPAMAQQSFMDPRFKSPRWCWAGAWSPSTGPLAYGSDDARASEVSQPQGCHNPCSIVPD